MASQAAYERVDEQREAFGAYLCDDETAALVLSAAQDHGWPGERIHKGGIANAVRSLSVMRSPEFLIVDLSESTDPRADISALVDVCEPGTLVLAMGSLNDVHLYRDLIASGIHDYLLKPVEPATLRESIAHALAIMAEPAMTDIEQKPEEKRKIAVIGVRGGVGASTIASGLSWLLAERTRAKIAFLDLDIHFGTGALAFDLEPGQGLSDALESPNRVDSLFIERAMLKVNDNLSILGSETPPGHSLVVDPSALQNLQDALGDNFDLVLIDLPRTMVSDYPMVLDTVSDIVLVTDLTLVGIRDTIRLLGFTKAQAPQAHVHMVLNKMSAPANQEVSQKDFEISIERKFDIVIPSDTKSLVTAAKQGKTLPQAVPNAKASLQLKQLAARLSADDGKTEKPTLWSRFTRK